MDINTLLDSLDQLFGLDTPEDSLVGAVQAQFGKLNSDEIGMFCLD